MSITKRHINSFRGGMREGIDSAQQNSNTYQHSMNGRVIFNEDGTWAWENTRGTKIVFQLNADYGNAVPSPYEIIGSDYVNGTLIIFSTNSDPITGIGNNEIGLVRQNQFNSFTYQTAFNDLYDPHGNNLRFSKQFNIVSDSVQENNVIERSYWNDDRNEPRAFNFIAGAVNPDDFTSGPYLPLGGANPGNVYPSWYSVHGMSNMPDLTWGVIKYRKNIAGTCKSGQRQYAYRYIHQTGYASPWSYLTDFIFLTKEQISATNWTTYQMSVSAATTDKGHELELVHLDTRFQKVEVACLYWETDAGATEATIVFEGEITGTTMIVTHTSDSGKKIAIDELTQKFFNIKKAKTQGLHRDNYYHLGNIELYEDLQIDTSGITVAPVIKRMLSDESGIKTNVPLTHQSPKNTTITKNIFDGPGGAIAETHLVENDYINYKGTQWTFLHKGRFRRETYPFALVIWNRKGQPLFAQHVTDYTFPEQFNDRFSDARIGGTTTGSTPGTFVLTDKTPGSTYQVTDTIQQGENICVNVMGIKFSNIRIPSNIMFDSNGNLQVSGFSIVAMDRFASIVGQGVLLNTIRGTTDACNDNGDTHPLAGTWNYLRFNGANPLNRFTGTTIEDCTFNARGNIHTFECPDFLIDNTLFSESSVSDRMWLVGACIPAYRTESTSAFDEPIRLDTGGVGNYHYYNKNYICQGPHAFAHIHDGVNEVNGPGFGTDFFGNPGGWTVDTLFANARSVSPLGPGSFFEQTCIRDYIDMLIEDPDDSFTSICHHGTVLVTMNLLTSSLRYGNSHCSYYIANYIKQTAIQQVTQVALENRVYHGIGHFVPINATTLAAAFDGANTYVFNNVEVWGGDCFTDFFGLDRLVPKYAEPGGGHNFDCAFYDNHHNPDYAIGLIFPVESKFNHSMRAGETYEKVATRPLSTGCGRTSVFPAGFFFSTDDNKKMEDFNVNKVLQAKDKLGLYNSKPTLLNPDVEDFPLMEIYAGAKFYGEEFDSYRRFLINQRQFAQGKYGEITCIRELFGQLYVYQRQAFGKIRFNERELVNTETGSVTTGTGLGYGGHDYISTEFGTQHQFSVVNNGKALYSVDAEKGKLIRFAQDGVMKLSDMDDARWIGLKLRDYWYAIDDTPATFENNFYDNPSYLGGIHGVFDFKNDAVVYTFTQRKEHRKSSISPDNPLGIVTVGEAKTVEFSEVNSAFATYHGFAPKWYLRMKQNYLSMNPSGADNNVFMHEEGIRGSIYGANQNSLLRFVSNPENSDPKTFDNGLLEVVGNVEIVKQVTAVTNIIPMQTITLNNPALDRRPAYREGRLVYPIMQKNQSVRLRGQYAKLEYTIENDGSDKLVRLTQHETRYRLSSRT